MRHPHRQIARRDAPERGATIIEVMVALVVLAVGILAIGQLFPAGSQGQQKDRMFTTANMLAQERLESLRAVDWADAALANGTHGPDSVGTHNQYALTYVVTQLAAPMDQVKRIDVNVAYTFLTPRNVAATTYIRR